MRFRITTEVAFSACGPDGALRPDALLDLLQEAAGLHARTLALSTVELAAAGRSWAMARERLVVRRWPEIGEPLTIETWPRGRERQSILRELRVQDRAGASVAEATTAWVIIDTATRAALADPGPVLAGVALEAEIAAGFATRTVGSLRAPEHRMAVRPRLADLDLNGHVNHARLATYLLEGLPRELARRAVLEDLDMLFRAECRLEDEVLSEAAPVAPGRFRHRLVRAADGKELARAESRWRA